MQHLMTDKQKRRQHNLIYQLWRLSVLSLKFIRLMRMGSSPAKEHHVQHAHPSPTPGQLNLNGGSGGVP